jgi:chromate transporter
VTLAPRRASAREDDSVREGAPGALDLGRYFLRLGTVGFGGPIALASAMQRDLVERRRWITAPQYLDGLALAQLMPGPLAAQLAIYIGWVRARLLGATVVAAAFVLPSFLMVLVLSMLYVRSRGMAWVGDAFYGVGPVVIAVIARGAVRLARMSLGRDRLLWVIFLANGAATALSGHEAMEWILAGGLVALAVRSPAASTESRTLGVLALGGFLTTGLHGPADAATLAHLAAYFAQAGALVFGSGLAIVPFLESGVVDHFRWIDERQFMDAVAIGMLTPGPVVITVAFIGFLVAGPLGAAVACLAVFVPCWLLVVIPAPHFARVARSRRLRHFVSGVTAATSGAIAGAVIVLGRRAVVDPPTVAIAIVATLAMGRWAKVPEPAWIVIGAAAGLALRAR